MRISVNTTPHPDKEFSENPFTWAITEIVNGEEIFIGLAGFSKTIEDAFIDAYEVWQDYEEEMLKY